MPLVVTDAAGKEPVVVLPFEVYEALVDGGEKVEKKRETPAAIPEISLEERFYVQNPEDQENR